MVGVFSISHGILSVVNLDKMVLEFYLLFKYEVHFLKAYDAYLSTSCRIVFSLYQEICHKIVTKKFLYQLLIEFIRKENDDFFLYMKKKTKA